MKDIKLTIEDIKKACEFADGFEWKIDQDKDEYWMFPNGCFYNVEDEVDFENDSNFDNIYYPLFLQRVIEGINISETNVNFDISYTDLEYKVECFDLSGEVREFKIFCAVDCGSIDQSKTQAIKYILDKLK